MLTLQLVYILIAAVGGAVLVIQTLMSVIGIGEGHDESPEVAGGDHDATSGMGLLSVRALASFLTFFGLVGWLATSQGWSSVLSAVAALLGGAAAMAMAAMLIRLRRRLDTDGSLDPSNAVSQTARVYLYIPERGAGAGKIQVMIQGRTAEFSAVSEDRAIPTGALVRVTRMLSPDTFVVEPLDNTR